MTTNPLHALVELERRADERARQQRGHERRQAALYARQLWHVAANDKPEEPTR